MDQFVLEPIVLRKDDDIIGDIRKSAVQLVLGKKKKTKKKPVRIGSGPVTLFTLADATIGAL
jgi:hypothetical protein